VVTLDPRTMSKGIVSRTSEIMGSADAQADGADAGDRSPFACDLGVATRSALVFRALCPEEHRALAFRVDR
jgi:hypothetical protein